MLADLRPRFIEHWNPKLTVTVFALLIITAAIAAQSDVPTSQAGCLRTHLSGCARITGQPESLSWYTSPTRKRWEPAA